MFAEKLNKKQDGSVYVIEEEQVITEGKYEGLLQHDNANIKTIKVFTGPKLAGAEVVNTVISVPRDTPWKTHIKVFADVGKVYISYETPGDIVEASDINLLQETAEIMREDFIQYSSENDAIVSTLKERIGTVETVKATKTYVDTELAKKADKSSTYTKTETDQRIQNVIGAAPAALDTLQEIGKALNNDPDFAATMTAQLASKVEKVTGKGLSTEDYSTIEKSKLAGIETGANKYVHPSTHVPSVIAQDTNNRFVTDADKAVWNGKASTAIATTSVNGLMSSTDKSKLDGIAVSANNYVHPGTGTNPHGTTKSDVGLGNLSNDAQVKRTEMGANSGVATLDAAGVNAQAPKAHTHDDRYYTETEANAKFATKEEVSQSRNGDMLRSIYDEDNDGIVDNAALVNGYSVESNVPANAKFTDTVYTHPGSGTNPHSTTKSDIGLGSVSNYGIATQEEAEAGTSSSKYMTPLRVSQAIAAQSLPKTGLIWGQLKGV